jgi:DMSO/TMAO reductase YedYZ molybdopterin-dependent catalytic subunit
VVGGQYALVGDGDTTLVRTTNNTQSQVDVESTPDGYVLNEEMFLDEVYRIGSQSIWLSPEGWQLHLSGCSEGPFRMTAEELLEYLWRFSAPVDIDGEFHWSTELTLDDLES